MKILLLIDLDYVDHHSLESVNPPTTPFGAPGREIASAGNQVHKKKGETLDVDPDNDSEAAEHEDGSTWFILRETGNRFKIRNEGFRRVGD
jgi:hypothetical protein